MTSFLWGKQIVLFCLIASMLAGAADKKSSSLEAELNAHFLGKSFSTRIIFGSYIRQDISGKECYRLIDTEYLPDGSMRYQARKGCAGEITIIPSVNFYVDRNQLTSALQPGRQVTVTKIDVKEDRIEFQLSSNPNSRSINNYAKLKLFIAGGTKQLTLEKVVAAAAEPLYIEEYEKQRELQAEFAKLSGELPQLRSRYADSSGTPDKRDQAGHALRDSLQKIISNRASAASGTGDSGQIQAYKTELATLDHDLPALDAVARTERIQTIKSKITSNQSRCGEFKAGLAHAEVSTLAEWQKKSSDIEQYRALLDERKNLVAQLSKEGDATETIMNSVSAEAKELENISNALNASRKHLQLAQVNSNFEEMKRRKLLLIDKYTRVYGTPQERSALQALISHIQSMLQNRNEAKALGAENAAREAASLDAEMQKYKRR